MNAIIKFIDKRKQDWVEKRYTQFWTVTLLFAAGVLSVLTAIIFLLYQIGSFIGNYFELLVTVSAATAVAIFYIKQHFDEKRQLQEQKEAERRVLQEEADQKILERNYKIVRSCIFQVAGYMSDLLKIKKPISEQDIDSPNHYIRKQNFILYQYILYPFDMSTTDTKRVHSILRQEVGRRLDAGLFSGISQNYYFFEGQAEPIISIYEVQNCGAYLTVSVAIADENYARAIRQGFSASLLNQAEQLSAPTDKDF